MAERVLLLVGGLIAFAKAAILSLTDTCNSIVFLVGSTAPIIAGIARVQAVKDLAFAASLLLLALSLAIGDSVLAMGYALTVLPHICGHVVKYTRLEEPSFPSPSEAIAAQNDRLDVWKKKYVRKR